MHVTKKNRFHENFYSFFLSALESCKIFAHKATNVGDIKTGIGVSRHHERLPLARRAVATAATLIGAERRGHMCRKAAAAGRAVAAKAENRRVAAGEANAGGRRRAAQPAERSLVLRRAIEHFDEIERAVCHRLDVQMAESESGAHRRAVADGAQRRAT